MAQVTERRQHPRASVEYQYSLSCEGITLSGAIRDLSPYGIGLFAHTAVPPASAVYLRLLLPDALRIDAKGEVVYCVANPDSAADPAPYLIGVKFLEGPMDYFSRTDAASGRSRHTPAHTIAINAEPKFCYDWLARFSRYPEWASGVKLARVLEAYPDGRGKSVEFVHDFFFRKVRYVLDYTYDDAQHVLSWVSPGADREIVGITGSYAFKSVGKSSTYATYTLDVTLSIIPSSRLVQYVTSTLMRKEMKNFKNFVEQEARLLAERKRS